MIGFDSAKSQKSRENEGNEGAEGETLNRFSGIGEANPGLLHRPGTKRKVSDK